MTTSSKEKWHAHTHPHIHTHAHKHTHAHTPTLTRTRTRTDTHTHTYIHAHTQTQTHTTQVAQEQTTCAHKETQDLTLSLNNLRFSLLPLDHPPPTHTNTLPSHSHDNSLTHNLPSHLVNKTTSAPQLRGSWRGAIEALLEAEELVRGCDMTHSYVTM